MKMTSPPMAIATIRLKGSQCPSGSQYRAISAPRICRGSGIMRAINACPLLSPRGAAAPSGCHGVEAFSGARQTSVESDARPRPTAVAQGDTVILRCHWLSSTVIP
jgi:hypothetical protein